MLAAATVGEMATSAQRTSINQSINQSIRDFYSGLSSANYC